MDNINKHGAKRAYVYITGNHNDKNTTKMKSENTII